MAASRPDRYGKLRRIRVSGFVNDFHVVVGVEDGARRRHVLHVPPTMQLAPEAVERFLDPRPT